MFIKADASANMQTSFRFLKKERNTTNLHTNPLTLVVSVHNSFSFFLLIKKKCLYSNALLD